MHNSYTFSTRPAAFRLLSALMICLGLLAETSTKVISADGSYSVEYPSPWRRIITRGPLLDIVNFSATEQIRGVMIPQSGAEIIVVKAPAEIGSLDEWIEVDQKFASRRSLAAVDTNHSNKEITRIVEAHWRSSIGPDQDDEMQEVGFYLSTAFGLFKVQLSYWPDNSAGTHLRHTARQIARSIRRNAK